MILLTPAHNELPAYRPVKFRLLVDTDPLTPAENAVVSIFKNGALLVTARFKSFDNFLSPFTPPNFSYLFDIDIQKYIQDSLSPEAAAPSLLNNDSPATIQLNTDSYSTYHIEVTYERISSTGIIEAVPAVSDTSADYNIFAASKKHSENRFLYDYIGNYPVLTLGKYLTKNTDIKEVTKEDYSFLSIIQNPLQPLDINCFRVRMLNSSFIDISTGYYEFASTAGAVQYSINCGFNQLQNYTYVQAPNFTLTNTVYYQITFGNLSTLPGPIYIFQTYSEFAVYKLKAGNCDRRALRLHWINMLGGLDSYTFDSEKALSITTNSGRSQKALAYEAGALIPDLITDIGNFKTNSKASESYKLKSKFLTNQQADFLSELLTSTKVYAEINGEFIPVIIEDTQQDTTTESGFIRYEITATLANDLIIQRI
ncbi:MAG: hypothetical protein KAS30_01405 [Candidatus Diapherotrites archaeon]|nr:hypothetical protein [Candidatus Diapherotrites archaeon]